MGCDIHVAVERRTADGWQRAEPMVPPRWTYDGGPEEERERWYDGRNYSLFAILADVRNGHGFAGVDTGDPVVPISEPRGLPDDVASETRSDSDEWGVDGHSHSHFTLAELMAFDWAQTITHRCWARQRRGLPSRFDGPDQYAAALQGAARSLGHLPSAEGWGYETCARSSEGQGASGWRTIEWGEPFWETVGTAWWGLVARMARAAGDDLSSVRIVFWFDN